MRDPDALVTFHHDRIEAAHPVLVYAFSGFVDAGSGVRLAADHLLATREHRLIATFDLDELFDYRARRPRMSFLNDHFASVDMPQITLHEVTDSDGATFLLLVGPEPDYQWQRFVSAVLSIAQRFQVGLAVGLAGVPWPAPHTRPIGITVHGTEGDIVRGQSLPLGELQVPGHVTALIELRLGEAGVPSIGLTAQVPHYLAQVEYPAAARVLLEHLGSVTGLALPVDGLVAAVAAAEVQIAEQLAGNEEFTTVLAALEQQYDQFVLQSASSAALAPDDRLPSAEELAEQVEAFLARLDRPEPTE